MPTRGTNLKMRSLMHSMIDDDDDNDDNDDDDDADHD